MQRVLAIQVLCAPRARAGRPGLPFHVTLQRAEDAAGITSTKTVTSVAITQTGAAIEIVVPKEVPV